MNFQLQNQELMVKESIKHFLKLYKNGNSDFSYFESIFFRLIQSMLDPPVEITWFYSAVTYHSAKSCSEKNNLSSRVLIAKDLLNLLLSCSNLSSASKKILLLAPVVYELHNILYDFRKSGLSVTTEVNKLLDTIDSYVLIFAGSNDHGSVAVEFENMAACFEDLVWVWTADRGGENVNSGDNMALFFPLLSDDIWRRMNSRLKVQELVGIVLYEMLLLRLCLSCGSGENKKEFLNDANKHVVHTTKTFHNRYFLDMLFKMLLEPCLPVTTLLCSQDAILLHKVLYDAVVLIDYSFYFERWSQTADNHSKKLAPLWLLVADRAIMFAWSRNEKAAALSYLDAFRKSQIVAEIINWVKIQTGIEGPNIRSATPRVLIEWLLILEDHGTKIFDSTLLPCAKATVSMSPMERNLCFRTVADKNIEMDNSSNNVLWPVNTVVDSKKRRESFPDVQESQLKHAKRDDNLVSFTTQNFFPCSSGDGSCDGMDVMIYVDSDDEKMDDE